jgi:hypothetical protein
MKKFKEYFVINEKLKPLVSTKQLMDKWKVSKDRIEKELDKGQKIEREHTTDDKSARIIASQHVLERLNFYSKEK